MNKQIQKHFWFYAKVLKSKFSSKEHTRRDGCSIHGRLTDAMTRSKGNVRAIYTRG